MEQNDLQPRVARVRLLANATVFIAGACIMTVELVAGRLISRYLGQSLYTWTSVIGVVLAGISLGNYAGGLIADRFRPRKALGWLFMVSSLACLTVPVTNHLIGQWTWLWEFSWPARILTHVTAVFLLPSLMLGMIGPVAAKMALEGGGTAGRALGGVYAWSSIGSIVGTFLTGFWLIAWMGTIAISLAVGGVLAVMAMLYGLRSWFPYAWLIAFAGAGFWISGSAVMARGTDIVYEDESQYSYIAVKQFSEDSAVRGIYLDKMMHSEMNINEPATLLYKYAWVYEAVLDKFSEAARPVNAFVIGGGGYTFPQYLVLTRPGSLVDVAEIDPAVTRAAYEACGLRTNPAIRIYDMDARNFVADRVRQGRAAPSGRAGASSVPGGAGGPRPTYDYVLGDTFNDYSVPYHLTTEEFNRQLSELMTPDGMYLLNMIDRFDSGRFLSAVIETSRRVFPGVYVFFCHRNLSTRGTYVVVCSKKPVDLSDVVERIVARHPDFYGQLLTEAQLADLASRNKAVVLTDDYAPVENLLASVVRQDRPDDLDLYYLKKGLEAAAKGRLDDAIAQLNKALERNPGNVQALYNLGVARMQKGESEKALQCFMAVVEADPANIGARNNAAVVMVRLGNFSGATTQLGEVLRIQPDDPVALENLQRLREAGL